jgi:hypothetical protein
MGKKKKISRNKIIRCPECGQGVLRKNKDWHLRNECEVSLKRRQKNFASWFLEAFWPGQRPEEIHRSLAPVPRNKRRCSNCSTVYLAKFNECPRCTFEAEYQASVVYCGVCGNKYTREKSVFHIWSACGVVRYSCITCRQELPRSDWAYHLELHLPPDADRSDREPSQSREVLHKRNTSVQRDQDRYMFVTGICYHCGRIAIPNSTACYSCGDK